MCGIAGIVRTGHKPIEAEHAKALLKGIASRGYDATGVAVIDSTANIYKAPGDVKSFLKTALWYKASREIHGARVVLLHTRSATSGTPQDNHNNHPIAGKKGIIVHNGVLYKPTGYETIGQTDTEQLLRAIEENGIVNGLAQARGSLAIAYIQRHNPKRLYLYRDGSPLVICRSKDFIFFASTHDTLKRIVKNQACFNLIENELYSIDLISGAIKTQHIKESYDIDDENTDDLAFYRKFLAQDSAMDWRLYDAWGYETGQESNPPRDQSATQASFEIMDSD